MSVVKAVFKRNVAAFFGNPAGYVFIILFVGLTAYFAFVVEAFFANNQANLDQLTFRMPLLLMIFVASVTMATWAEEKKLGTDELLFTLPSGDFPVVLGKFLAALAVFTAALFFTLSHVLILFHLGDPDVGLLFATYLGYWLLGAAFIATGMFASSLTSNITVGFILGVLFCAVFAFMDHVATLLPGRLGEALNAFAAMSHLDGFGRGVVALQDILYFFSIVAGMLYLNTVVLARRRWPGGAVPAVRNPRFHTTVRILSVAVILVSVNVLTARFGGRVDVTEEKLSTLSGETLQILSDLSPKRPVYVEAWISKKVPPRFVETRDNLVRLFKEYDARGGDALHVKIHHTERFSKEAREAKEKYNIDPMPVYAQEEGEGTSQEIFLGAAFTCGTEEAVIPFFHPGLPIEYELTRTIRVVSKAKRPKVGVVDNELKLFGGFDFQTRSRSDAWQIVDELKKQYDVDTLRLDAEVPEDIDVVVAALPSLCTDAQLDNLIKAIRSGKPTLLLMDPLPMAAVRLSPRLPRPNPQANPFMGRSPPGEPKCDLNKLLDMLGVKGSKDTIVWDTENPYPFLRHLSPEYTFITHREGRGGEPDGFNQEDEVSSGLQEVLAIFGGGLAKSAVPEGQLTFTPLLRTSVSTSGTIRWTDCVQQTFFGPQPLPPEILNRVPRYVTPTSYVLAARVTGELPLEKKEKEEKGETAEKEEKKEGKDTAEAEDPAEEKTEKQTAEVAKQEEEKQEKAPETAHINVILVSDLDLISDLFFEIRKSGGRNRFEFDNVPFILNCVDSLAGDDSYIALRKRRRKARTLTRIEALEANFVRQKLAEEAAAEADAQVKLAEAQRSFDEKVKAVENRTDLDMRTKEIMLASVKRVEEQRLAAKKKKIEEEKNRKIEESRFAMEEEKSRIRRQKKYMAMILPVLPPLLIGLIVYFLRRGREIRGAAESRLLRD